MKKNPHSPVYITTTLPYVNGMPHIGHTVEFIRADVLARFYRLSGHDVFLNTGLDEHGKKVQQKAEDAGQTPQEYVDAMAKKWADFCELINMDYNFFSRTTAAHHEASVQKFWQVCQEAGYIYKAQYTAKYCVGCEMEKTDSDLDEHGECPDHPGKPLEHIDEENYFFKYTALQDALLDLYAKEPSFITPEFRRTEIKNFVESGLRDFSISRLKEKVSWGVSVPGDDEHVMYVWFDALPNYISCLGWGSDDESNFKKYWEGGTVIQFAGKDNLRPQTAMWQAMLAAAGIKHSDNVFIEGHIISQGMKMSKTIGNVIDPFEYIDNYGVEPLRYFLVRHIHNVQDADFTRERFHDAYMADLVNGLGNLTARVMKLAETHLPVPVDTDESCVTFAPEFTQAMEHFDFNAAADYIWRKIGELDEDITRTEPFKVVKANPEQGRALITDAVVKLTHIAAHLRPIMPQSAETILAAIKENKKPENLFARKELA